MLYRKIYEECIYQQNCYSFLEDTSKNLSDFYKCPQCKFVFNLKYKNKIYEDSYFSHEYKAQYGVNYLNDEHHIKDKVRNRLHKISQVYFFSKNCSLLEIGSAAGFALDVCKNEYAMDVEGWEVSKTMSDYANKRGLFTKQGSFKNLMKHNKKKYHLILAFYVIEHFDSLNTFWNQISNVLHKDGLLILTVPSYFGPLYFFDRKKWERTHPVDHFIDYSPASLKEIVKKFSLKLLHISPDSLHPERFIGGRFKSLAFFYKSFQKKMNFADTILVALQKTR